MQQQQQQQQMLYIPGLGYFPLSSLGGLPGVRQQQQQQPEVEKEWTTLASFPVRGRVVLGGRSMGLVGGRGC